MVPFQSLKGTAHREVSAMTNHGILQFNFCNVIPAKAVISASTQSRQRSPLPRGRRAQSGQQTTGKAQGRGDPEDRRSLFIVRSGFSRGCPSRLPDTPPFNWQNASWALSRAPLAVPAPTPVRCSDWSCRSQSHRPPVAKAPPHGYGPARRVPGCWSKGRQY